MSARVFQSWSRAAGRFCHAGGLAALRRLYPGVKVLAPRAFSDELQPDAFCEAGKHWQWNGVEFSLLHPAGKGSLASQAKAENDQSCVLLIRFGEVSVLLPGDIEEAAESQLVRHWGRRTGGTRQARVDLARRHPIDVLVAPHHGSATSSTPEFVDFLRPRYVVFPVGWANRYGFPAESVELRYKNQGASLFRTDQSGAVSFHIGRDGVLREPDQYRQQRRRIWSLWN